MSDGEELGEVTITLVASGSTGAGKTKAIRLLKEAFLSQFEVTDQSAGDTRVYGVEVCTFRGRLRGH
jgi:hypothetical protein